MKKVQPMIRAAMDLYLSFPPGEIPVAASGPVAVAKTKYSRKTQAFLDQALAFYESKNDPRITKWVEDTMDRFTRSASVSRRRGR